MGFLSKERLFRWFIYFRRGHGTYLVFFLSFANFIVIQFSLLVQYVPFLQLLFPNLIAFAIAFVFLYVPISIIIGWLDTKKGTIPVVGALDASVNPWSRDLVRALYLMCEGRHEEAKKVLEKWVK